MAVVALFFLKIVSQLFVYPLFVKFPTQLYIFYTNPLYYIHNLRRPNRRRPCRRRTHGSPPPPFSVLIHDANFAHSSATLSAIRIDSSSCPPLAQAIYKSVRFTQHNAKLRHAHSRIFRLQGIFKYLLFPLLFFHRTPTIHAMPGTNYAIINGDSSMDVSMQRHHANNLIRQLTPTNDLLPEPTPDPTAFVAPPGNVTTPVPKLRQHPICFVADTESVKFFIDLVANRIILNDAKL